MGCLNSIIAKLDRGIDNFLKNSEELLECWREWNKNNNGKIVVFGAGLMGERVCGYLESLGIKVDYVCDNDRIKQGKDLVVLQKKAIPVVAPQKMLEESLDVHVIISTGFHLLEDIQQQLKQYNVKSIFSHKYMDYYLEAIYMFANLEKKVILDKFIELLGMFDDEESWKICWCHLREVLGVKDESEEISFEKMCVLPQYFSEERYFRGKRFFVDCGAYTGDTLESLISGVKYDGFKEYVCFELDVQNFKLLEAYVKKLDVKEKVILYNLGVGKEAKQIRYNYNGDRSAIMDNGSWSGEVIVLDEYLANKEVSFLKMDIEGNEQDALQGAKKLIKRNKPVCAICIYHSVKDLFVLPGMLKELVPEYHLVLKHHSKEWCDTVCYASID